MNMINDERFMKQVVTPTHLRISLKPITVVSVLALIATSLILVNIAGQFLKYVGGHTRVFGLIEAFHLDREASVPAFFSTLLLLTTAATLGLVAAYRKAQHATFVRHWIALAILFAFLALDENVGFHELLIKPMRSVFDAGGWFHFAWVIPGFIFVCVVAVIYFRFLLHLPRATRALFTMAAVLYVGGAIGMEIVDGHYVALHGADNLQYNLLASLEESLEMTGVIVFIYAILQYLAACAPDVHMHITLDKTAASIPERLHRSASQANPLTAPVSQQDVSEKALLEYS